MCVICYDEFINITDIIFDCNNATVYDGLGYPICKNYKEESISELQIQLLIGFVALLALYILYTLLCRINPSLEKTNESIP